MRIAIVAIGVTMLLASWSAKPVSALPADDTGHPIRDDASLGGPATTNASSADAFGRPAPVLSASERRAFAVGNSFFRDNWVIAPASTAGRDGLGPLFNVRSCSGCHRRDGRGRSPSDVDAHEFTVRIAVRGKANEWRSHPVYGDHVQLDAIPGVPIEARLHLTPRIERGQFGDGEAWQRARFEPKLVEPGYGDPSSDNVGVVALDIRIAPQLIGLGLLEMVSDAAILEHADPDDSDGDGISGRPHRRSDGRIGRFGWKAAQASLATQIANAFADDIGITSTARRDEALTAKQVETVVFTSGGLPEIDDHKFGRVVFYCRTLAVPGQRQARDARVLLGKQRFVECGCASCHVMALETAKKGPVAAFSGATIHPYSDLLLHDMGDGLAGAMPEGAATAREWRTPPLWGIGLLAAVSGDVCYLHDGRGRSLVEAILWHGGEGDASRRHYEALPRDQRHELLVFLRSI